MNCIKVEEYAQRYEEGTLNEIEKRKFEKHLKECFECKKKYGALLLLGAVLYASEKTAVQTTFTLPLYIKQVAAATAVAAALASSLLIVSEKKESQKVIDVGISQTENVAELNKSKTAEEANVDKTKLKREDSKNRIKIISKEEGREIELNLDKKNLRIERRNEK